MERTEIQFSSRTPSNWNIKTILVVVVVLLIGISPGECQASQDINSYLQYTDGLTTFWADTLASLYGLSQNFIVAITGNGLFLTVVEELGLNISDPSTFTLERVKNITINTFLPKLAMSGAGYIVIIVIGIILIIFFLTSCCTLFCCRKCGCCCGKVADNNINSSDVPVIVVLFVALVAVSILMFLSAYGSIVSGLSAVDSLKDDNESGLPFVGNILPAVRHVPVFINRTIEDVNDLLNVSKLQEVLNGNSSRITSFIEDFLSSIDDECKSCGQLIIEYKSLVSYSQNISRLLDIIDASINLLNEKYNEFNESLNDFKYNVNNANNCTDNDCEYLRGNISMLFLIRNNITFINLTSINETLQEINSYDDILFGNISSIIDPIKNVTRDFIQSIKNQFDGFIGNLRNSGILDFDKNYLSRNSTLLANLPWDIIDQAAKYVPIVLKVLSIVIGAIFMLIILLNIFGLIFSPVCLKSNPKTGEKIFLASSQISFIFGAPFCILAILLFIFGTPVYREMCLDVRKESNSSYFKIVDLIVQEQLSQFNNNSSDNLIRFKTNEAFLITKTIEINCKNNDSLLSLIFDILIVDNNTVDGLINRTQPYLDEFVKNLNLSNLPIFSNETIDKLLKASTDLNNVNLTIPDYNISILSVDLDVIGELMNNTLDNLQDNRSMEILINSDLHLLKINVADIKMKENELLNRVNEAKTLINNVSNLLLKMANDTIDALHDVKNISTTSLIDKLKVVLRETFWEFYDYFKNKLSTVGKCRELYDIFNLVFYFLCDLVINPVNAYWFTLGISIALLLPSFLTGLWLGGLFARRRKAFDDYEDSQDDVDDEFENVKVNEYMSKGQSKVQTPSPIQANTLSQTQPLPKIPTTTAPAQGVQTPRQAATPSNNLQANGNLENASLYYIPPFSNIRQSRPLAFNSRQEPYYNMPYFRVPQLYGARPGAEVRIPRPWRPPSNGMAFAPYSRF